MARKIGKITGIGGVFFKCKDPQAMRKWFHEKFGLSDDKYGHPFLWKKHDSANKNGYTVWNPFDDNSDYFKPSKQKYMINYRVENLQELIEELRESGVTIVGDIQSFEYGKFGWILDPEGNKMELWEPIDSSFDEYYGNK